MHEKARWIRGVAGLVVMVLGAAGVTGQAPAATTASTSTTVSVNATGGLGTIPSNAIGLNTAVYDGHMNDPAIPGLVKAAGITALRYPGGSYSDIYNWQTNVAQGGYDAPNTSFADFMKTAQATGANPIITVNYGTGTDALAQAWVHEADVTDNYGITYWEVGNEVYGNGTYGANWEADSRCTDASGKPVTVGSAPAQTYNCGPATYASNVLKYITAMKAASPNIHVCAVLTTPGFWPDGVTNPTTSPQPWNQTVLSALGAKTDCVIVHYYPGGSTTAGMLTDPDDIPGVMSTLRSQIRQYAGVDPAGVKIVVTETNSSIDLDTQPAALFGADMYMSWLEHGVTNVDWWNEHNGPGTPSVVNGAQDYGDQGIFSNGANGSGVTEPAVNTPFSPYYAIQMLSRLGSPGDQMVTSSSANPLVRTHAVRRANGSLDVLIDNEDPSTTYSVGLNYNNFTPSGSPTVFTLANNGTSITSTTQSSATSVTVAPYSLTVVQVPGSGGTGTTAPGAPGQPTVSNLTSSGAVLSWPAGTAGSYPIARYDVYSGTSVVTTTTGTSVTLTGLTIGSTYTYNVVAVDTHGNASLPSPPVTFTVPPPANSSCAVHYEVTSSWNGGFGASITVTNRAATAVNGWNLTFAWPDAGEAVQAGWNGTWSQTGQQVAVTNADWNRTIASGGSVSLGFNGTDTGAAPAPTAFSLNGTVCSSI
ncbi:cellulose binding domain-containing protein [Kutzneria buriramensis]|uniref:Fibronectin type III domain protein n=1 Tax=Kutzneria buriramensis TaxID=1045776 RepID=A0A3E0GU75_9PSEU|nr:cellulose binding domain-containing protein [Kutzneria buriramensis]REH27769.1 fibronectin type III domain protein [Kutzneria buriramensis]